MHKKSVLDSEPHNVCKRLLQSFTENVDLQGITVKQIFHPDDDRALPPKSVVAYMAQIKTKGKFENDSF